MSAPKDPEKRKLWIERSIKSRTGLKRSNKTKEKMRCSAFKRNTKEYIQKLKDNHPANKNKELWEKLCKDNSIRMTGENNPMKDPVISKLVRDQNFKGESLNYLHSEAYTRFGKDRCEICGMTNEEHKLKHRGNRRFSMHCRDANNYTDLSSENWVTVCEFGCHQKMDRLDRK